MCYDLLRFSLCSSICAMACKLRCYISSLLVIALSPPQIHCFLQQQQNPRLPNNQNNNTPTHTSNILDGGGLKKSTYLHKVCALIVFRKAISGSLFNNQQQHFGRNSALWRKQFSSDLFARARRRVQHFFSDLYIFLFFHIEYCM